MSKKKKKIQENLSTGNNNIVEGSNYDIALFKLKYAERKYKSEFEREEAIIQQAATMQTAFSFITAAIFMLLPVVCEYRGKLSFYYIVLVFASIIACLIVSLIFATMALQRREKEALQNIADMNLKIDNYSDLLLTHEQQALFLVKNLEEVQSSVVVSNEKRVHYLRLSQNTFYLSLALCVIWFFVSIVKIV